MDHQIGVLQNKTKQKLCAGTKYSKCVSWDESMQTGMLLFIPDGRVLVLYCFIHVHNVHLLFHGAPNVLTHVGAGTFLLIIVV